MQTPQRPFNIMIVAQRGRLSFEALIFAASLRAQDSKFQGRLFVAEPKAGPLWSFDPGIQRDDIREALARLGSEVVPFENRVFGESYPNANKAEGLSILPEGEPFVFFDSDTLITGPLSALPFDFSRPTASMRREATWPKIELYGPGYTETWRALYDRFGLDFESSLDPNHPDEFWQRYLYFNAGWFTGACPRTFGARFTEVMREIRDDTPPELVCQPLYPWLDQIALPIVIHELGGGRPPPDLAPLDDGRMACHWRALPLLYAREDDRVIEILKDVTAPNWLKKTLKEYEPFRRMIFQGRGEKVRALFDRDALPRKEQTIRNRIKSKNLWMR
ncbi:hypothetical protein [Ovoidimarina sediminis]|uniref:hypothetical protein n=1 Tax=Ovoidimarina sediminis TaxID=3079856 RepID=UPI00290D7C33|nr:hypothetical protein [Rhodophyticola sp. MJ-SS7]MDU8944818.1 hypothetical protein [Rhodophyticola sp. MJ-SS7]